jgi:uncharacterized protein YkwD
MSTFPSDTTIHTTREVQVTRLLAAAGLTGLLVAGSLTSGASAQAAGGQDWGAASQFIGQINGARAANHRPRLTISSTLTSVAAGWAASMARSNRLAHNPRLASSVHGWKYLGENVGVGDSVSQLEAAFWDSAGHRANMLDTDFTQVGVAVVSTGGRLWVAEEFMRPSGSSASSHGTSSSHVASRASASGSSGRKGRAETLRPTALEMAQSRLLQRIFAARHDSKTPNLDVQAVQDRTELIH